MLNYITILYYIYTYDLLCVCVCVCLFMYMYTKACGVTFLNDNNEWRKKMRTLNGIIRYDEKNMNFVTHVHHDNIARVCCLYNTIIILQGKVICGISLFKVIGFFFLCIRPSFVKVNDKLPVYDLLRAYIWKYIPTCIAYPGCQVYFGCLCMRNTWPRATESALRVPGDSLFLYTVTNVPIIIIIGDQLFAHIGIMYDLSK